MFVFSSQADRSADTSYKDVIVDVKSSPGGDISDLNFLLGHLINKPLHFGYTQAKASAGPFEFTPWIDAFVNPISDHQNTQYSIIVLADNASASLAETIVMAVHAFPGSKFIGETTWGATGPSTAEDVYNDGQFIVSSFMSVQTSSCKFKYLDNNIYENVGFPPDIFLKTDIQALSQGKDSQLEKAISQF